MLDKDQDNLWRATAADAGSAKDPRLAKLGSSLALRVRDWLQSRGTDEPLEAPPFEDAATLVRSRLTWPIICGAKCAAEIARVRADGGPLLLGLYRGVPAKSRCMMLRFSTSPPELADTVTEMVALGLVDRSREVRCFATEQVTPSRSGVLLPTLRAAAAVEVHAPEQGVHAGADLALRKGVLARRRQ